MNNSPQSNISRRIACPTLLLPDGRLANSAVITFSTDGTLLSVETDVENIDRLPQTEYHNGVVIPSIINAHNHLELSYFEGLIPQGTGLVEFIKYVVKHRNDLQIPERIAKLKIQDKIMWARGTGAVGDKSNDPFSLAVKAKSQIYYHTFAEYFGLPNDSEAVDLFRSLTEPIISEAEKLQIKATPSPHSTYFVSDKMLRLGDKSQRISIHFMETSSELDFYQKRGEMYNFITSNGNTPDFLKYGSHTQRLIESLPPDIPLLLVHCTQMKKTDIEKILSYFNNVTFVLCPRSNYYIERTFPPAKILYEMGAQVALGTDSLCSNTSLNLISEVEWLAKNNPSIPLEKILYWATVGGATALGIQESMGKFAPGTKCGAVIVEGLSPKDMSPIGSLTSRRLI